MEVAVEPAGLKLEKTHYTEAEYHLLQEESPERLEFYNGQIIAMAGGSGTHSLLCSNLIRILGNALLESDALVANSDLRIYLDRYKSYVFPDAIVVAEHFDYVPGRTDAILNPLLIVEVASPSTRAHDRGPKFAIYRTIPSFKEYVLVEQDTRAITTFFRTEPDTWKTTDVTGLEGSIHLRSIDVHLPLAEVYRKVL